MEKVGHNLEGGGIDRYLIIRYILIIYLTEC